MQGRDALARKEPVAPVRDRGSTWEGRPGQDRAIGRDPMGRNMGGGQGSEACLLVRDDKYHSRGT